MSAPRPRLLFIAPAMPDCGGNGLAMRQGQFLAAYAQSFDVDLAVVPLAGAADANAAFAQTFVRRLQVFALEGVDTHFSLLLRLNDPAAKLAAFKTYGRPSLTARLTNDLRLALAAWGAERKYQLVHIGRLYLLDVITAEAPLVLDADEDDARVYLQMAQDATRRGASITADWLAAEAKNAARHAARHLPSVQHVFAASAADAAALAPLSRAVALIPNTVARTRMMPHAAAPARILFVGTLGYGPNQDAIMWFIDQCWHRLRRHLPLLQFDIVGQGASPALRRRLRQQNIVYHGWQKDLRPFYARAGAVIVPVRMGGGSRIKFLEAAAYGCAIASTKAGAEGSSLLAKRDFAGADDPARFRQAVMRALQHRRVLGRAARLAVARAHDPASWQAKILGIAKAIASADMA